MIYLSKFVILHSMRLNKLQIEHMAFVIARGLVKDDLVITDDREALVKQVEIVIQNELDA